VSLGIVRESEQSLLATFNLIAASSDVVWLIDGHTVFKVSTSSSTS